MDQLRNRRRCRHRTFPFLQRCLQFTGGHRLQLIQDARRPFHNSRHGFTRHQMQRKFLDSTTPLQRAQLSDFVKALQQRRQELGLATLPPPPF